MNGCHLVNDAHKGVEGFIFTFLHDHTHAFMLQKRKKINIAMVVYKNVHKKKNQFQRIILTLGH